MNKRNSYPALLIVLYNPSHEDLQLPWGGGVQRQGSRAHQQMLRALHTSSDGRHPSSHHKGQRTEGGAAMSAEILQAIATALVTILGCFMFYVP